MKQLIVLRHLAQQVLEITRFSYSFARLRVSLLQYWQLQYASQHHAGRARLLSSPGELHPEALPELYVSVSTHTAPMVKNRLRCCSQSASRLG